MGSCSTPTPPIRSIDRRIVQSVNPMHQCGVQTSDFDSQSQIVSHLIDLEIKESVVQLERHRYCSQNLHLQSVQLEEERLHEAFEGREVGFGGPTVVIRRARLVSNLQRLLQVYLGPFRISESYFVPRKESEVPGAAARSASISSKLVACVTRSRPVSILSAKGR